MKTNDIFTSEALTVGVAVNDNKILAANLMSSPALKTTHMHVCAQSGYLSAGLAYNRAIDQSRSSVLILAHQDVYLPAGWMGKLAAAIEHLEEAGESWAILGVLGIRANGQYAGRAWCTGGGREHVWPFDGVVIEVDSIDEIVIVLNREAGLRFDEHLPGFHLYATDIILQAQQKGYKAFVFDGPVVHNSRCNPRPVDAAYIRAYRYMQRKWAAELPVYNCVVPVTHSGWPLMKHILRREYRLLRQSKSNPDRPSSPAQLAAALGYEPEGAA